MSRHFSLATRLLILMVGIASTCFATTGTEVLYVQENLAIVTYNTDPTTLQVTRIGSPLALTGNPALVQVVSAPHGRFIYVTSGPNSSQITLSVYATDENGVPQEPAIEILGPSGISQFAIHSSGRFAYLIDYTENSDNEFLYTMRLYTVDGSTGYLTETSYEHKFKPTSYCAPWITGFYPDGNDLEYVWSCSPPESGVSEVFFQQSVDLQTGELGRPAQLFSYGGTDLNANEVKLAPHTINDFYQDFAPTDTELRIYPLAAGSKKPTIDCTALMLSACAQAGGFEQDVSGRYLLLELPKVMEIVKIDLSNNSIVDTGYSIPETVQPYFSPDDSIIYGLIYQYQAVSSVQIYGFDTKSGATTKGERFSVGKNSYNLFPALRE